MDAVTRSSSSCGKVASISSCSSYRNGDGFNPGINVAALTGPKLCLHQFPNHLNVFGFSLSVSYRHSTVRPIFPASSMPSSDTQTLLKEEGRGESLRQDITDSRTVRVNFQLQRECLFGQQFLIVGDDPMFGSWDPSNAVPLNWSDGHLWSVELDLPVGRSVKFKFILKSGTQSILWQPGPDRTIQPWETGRTIIVREDWDNADLQIVMEEGDPILTPDKESSGSDVVIVEDVPGEQTVTDTNLGTLPVINGLENHGGTEENTLVDVNDIMPGPRVVTSSEENILGDTDRAVAIEDVTLPTDKTDHLVSYEGIPVLVPGMTPLFSADTEEASPNMKAEDLNVPEPKMQVIDFLFCCVLCLSKTKSSLRKSRQEDSLPRSAEFFEVTVKDEMELSDNECGDTPTLSMEQNQSKFIQFDNSIFKNDIQWCRRTIRKFISNMGFFMTST